MLQNEYEKLVEYLEEMICDGCQLVHGGNLLDWHDTKILKVLQKIKALRERESPDTRKTKK